MTKTLPNIANPHIRIYREIGQQVLASIEDGWTDTHRDRRTNFMYRDVYLVAKAKYRSLQIEANDNAIIVIALSHMSVFMTIGLTKT